MLKYTIEGTGKVRVVIVKAMDLMRYQLHDSNGRIQFKSNGVQAVAIAFGKILIFKKPNAHTFHREYVLQNNRTLYHSNTMADTERIVDGLMELEAKV